jgi:phosphoglycolate phosphatase
MIKNIIFDWSGVIKDSVGDHLFAVNKIFQHFGAKQMTLEELKEKWVQPHMVFYNKYLPDLSNEQQTVIYKKAIMECIPKAYQNIAELIKELRTRGVKMVVVSSDLIETVTSELTIFGLNNLFLEVVPNIHDKTETVKNLIDKYNFDKSETVIIGDTNHEIEVGKLVGIKTVAVTWGFTSEIRLIINHPDFLIHNLNELSDCLFNF